MAVASWGEGGGTVSGETVEAGTQAIFFVRLVFVGLKLFRSVWTIAGLWDLG